MNKIYQMSEEQGDLISADLAELIGKLDDIQKEDATLPTLVADFKKSVEDAKNIKVDDYLAISINEKLKEIENDLTGQVESTKNANIEILSYLKVRDAKLKESNKTMKTFSFKNSFLMLFLGLVLGAGGVFGYVKYYDIKDDLLLKTQFKNKIAFGDNIITINTSTIKKNVKKNKYHRIIFKK